MAEVVWYTTPEAAQEFLEKLDPEGMASNNTLGPVTQAEVEIACFDIDRWGVRNREITNGDELKLTPALLAPSVQNRLARAVAFQIGYRRGRGPQFFMDAQYESVRGAGVSTQGKLPYLAPPAYQELVDAGLVAGNARPSQLRVDMWDTEVRPCQVVPQPLFPHLRRRGW